MSLVGVSVRLSPGHVRSGRCPGDCRPDMSLPPRHRPDAASAQSVRRSPCRPLPHELPFMVMAGWLLWTLIAVALAVGELFTPGLFFLGPVALAALAAALTDALGGGAGLTLIVFIAGSVASLGVLRPVARRHVRMPALARTGTDALVGRTAVVLRRVDDDGGRVRIGGEEWSARAYLEGQVFDEGTRVDVVKIEGATALVVE